MVTNTSDGKIFVTYGERSIKKYHKILSEAVKETLGPGPFTEDVEAQKTLLFSFNWLCSIFTDIIVQRNDSNFALFLFANHEVSIGLYMRRLGGEDLETTEGISENNLALNRRILKLALEQVCEVDYMQQLEVTQKRKQEYIEVLEDLLYLGKEIYSFADHMAERRMMEDANRIFFDDTGLLAIRRNHHYDHIYDIMQEIFEDGFKEGIVSHEMINELKTQLQDCMHINYDFAGGLIFQIKEHHSPGNPFQTVEPAILPANLVSKGIDEQTAANFYEGLTLSRKNKLKTADAVYKINSLERYLFRPILIINQNGHERALVGMEKWSESIMVLTTNCFQWQKAPAEWLTNKCFRDFIHEKADQHDKLLEDALQEQLEAMNLPYYRHVLGLRDAEGHVTRVDVPGLGEMDFIFIDHEHQKIIVAECKYQRARYEMVGFSTDFKNFSESYEPKLLVKETWLFDNRNLVAQEFTHRYPGQEFLIENYIVEGLLIINTPTFYMMNGRCQTITINNFTKFAHANYRFPVIQLKNNAGEIEKEINHPYFRIQ